MQIEREEIIEEEEEELIDEKLTDIPNRVKRTRGANLNQTKKVIKQTKKLLKQSSRERQASSLTYLLNAVKGSIKLNTEFEFTTFQLDLPTDNLKSILEDFYLRFKDLPTFSEYLIKETLKVLKHDYFQNVKANSMMKLKMLLCYLAQNDELKNYPSNPFLDVQTESSLQELRDKLQDFFTKFYRPNRMRLIIKSNMKLVQMEELLSQTFANLTNNEFIPAKHDPKRPHILNGLFVEKQDQQMFYIKPHTKKPEIEDYLPIRQNLMVNLDKFEEYNLNKQLEEKLVEENGLDRTISNKISYDNNHLIFSYTSHRQIQSKDEEHTTNQLCFIFNVPYNPTYYPLMPMHFISSLICKEGPGTLISYLRKRDLIGKIQADNLNDCNFSNNSIWNLYFIKIYLTRKGNFYLEP